MPTETDVTNADNVVNQAYTSWTTAHGNTVTAQAAATVAANTESPFLATFIADAQAAVTQTVSWLATCLRQAGQDPSAILGPSIAAVLTLPVSGSSS
jgi:hypothetical protein